MNQVDSDNTHTYVALYHSFAATRLTHPPTHPTTQLILLFTSPQAQPHSSSPQPTGRPCAPGHAMHRYLRGLAVLWLWEAVLSAVRTQRPALVQAMLGRRQTFGIRSARPEAARPLGCDSRVPRRRMELLVYLFPGLVLVNLLCSWWCTEAQSQATAKVK